MNSEERNLLGETTGPPGSLDGAGVAGRMSAPSGGRGAARGAGPWRETVGSQEEQQRGKRVVTEFGAFSVTVIVSEIGRYEGIEEIKLSKEYLAHAYKLSARGLLDIEVPEEE